MESKIISDDHPSKYCCPITGTIIDEPVTDNEGNNFEKVAIENWLSKHTTSPVTGNPLSLSDLKPNPSLKVSIEDYKVYKNSNLKHSENQKENQNSNSLNNSLKNNLSLKCLQNKDSTLLILTPPIINNLSRSSTNLIVVIDISGSMGDEAKIKTDSTSTAEGFGFSILDLVKHATKTLINSLNENDSLSIISYSSNAKVELEFTAMDDNGKKLAEIALQKLVPTASTNLWAGLHLGLNTLFTNNSHTNLYKNSAIFLLTDGLPNVEPPRGHIPMLQKYISEKGLPGIINTFGFGYSLDSNLLKNIAKEGLGTYAFIPDGSFVGTIFVNALSNLLTTQISNVSIMLNLEQNKVTLKNLNLLSDHYYKLNSNDTELEIKIGFLNIGQSKHLFLPISSSTDEVESNGNKKINFHLSYYDNNGFKQLNNYTCDINLNLNKTNEENEEDMLILTNTIRINFINAVLKAMELFTSNQNNARKIIEDLIIEISEISSQNKFIQNSAFIKDLLKDITEQVQIAFSRGDYYNKWGVHYLPSLTRSHLLENCNNFKDPGVQHYSAEAFSNIRDKIDYIFMNIPVPEPSIKSLTNYNNSYNGNSLSTSSNSNVSSMRMFNNCNNPCFEGNCKVLMADGSSFKLVKNVEKNDLVFNNNKVICVLKTLCTNSKADLVEFKNGLKITPWHPVRIENKWQFPCMVKDRNLIENFNFGFYENIEINYEEKECEAVYSFVMENGYIMIINEIECVTLGHNFKDEIVRHDYFGSCKVVEDLKKIKGWEEGLIVITPQCVKRDSETGMINEIVELNL